MKSLSVYLFYLLSFVNSMALLADTSLPCNSQVVCGEVGKVQISKKGSEKILEIALDSVTQTIDIKDELNNVLGDSEKLPYEFDLGAAKKFGMTASIDNIRFDELSFGSSKVNINEREVNVCVPIDEMDLKVDAEFDIWGNKLTQKGASARVRKDALDKPEVCFTGEVDESGEFSELVALPWEEPKDVLLESKRALLEMDLKAASDDEIMFSYLTLYSMEEGHELPTNVGIKEVWSLMGDFTSKNAQKLLDVEKMRTNLIAIKGEMPPAPETSKSKTGLRNYMGTLEVDLALESNKDTIVADDKVWDDMSEIIQKPIPDRIADSNEGRVMSWLNGLGHAIKSKSSDALQAVTRGVAGIGNRLTMKGESLMRERLLPFLQEKFNQNATNNPPVMTAIAKTAEKKLIPVARKHANLALQKAREIISRKNLAHTRTNIPGFQLQDVIDDTTLRQLEARLGPNTVKDLIIGIDKIKTTKDRKAMREQAKKFLLDVEQYADAISLNSTDERTHRFLQKGLAKLTGNITDFLISKSDGEMDADFLNLRQNVLYKLQNKERVLARNIAQKRELMNMELVPKLFSEKLGGPEVSLAFPELCQEGLGTMKEELPGTKGYDLSATVSVDGINAMLRKMQGNGAFDFCLFGKEARSCQSGDNFDHKCKMELPPKFAWNGVKGSHQILLDGVKCESRFLNAQKDCNLNPDPEKSFLHALAYPFAKILGGTCKLAVDITDEFVTGGIGKNEGQVAIDIKPEICGKALCFRTELGGVNVENDLKSLSPGLKAVGGIITAIATPITNMVKTQIVDDHLMNFLENDVSQPLQAPLGVVPQRVESTPGKISVYADFERTPVVEAAVDQCLKETKDCAERFF